MKFPKHKCGLYISHNQHLNCYRTIEEYIDDIDDEDFISEEDKAECIKSGDIWEIQWYPDTPVGCYIIYASTLEKAIEEALKTESEVRQ